MATVLHLARKETLLLLRDRNALLLLFVMPAVFILIMSLALQSRYAAEQGVQLPYYLVNQDSGPINDQLLAALEDMQGFRMQPKSAAPVALRKHLDHGEARILLVIPSGFGEAMPSAHPKALEVTVAADVAPPTARLFTASLRGALGQVFIQQLVGAEASPDAAQTTDNPLAALIDLRATAHMDSDIQLPSSVQQSVPAWLLFAMFFIAIPLSTTWVQERDQGTYARLRSMGVSAPAMLTGKLVPYVLINLLQVVVMLLVGVYVVPWAGGDQLLLGNSWGALAAVSLTASVAAVSWALLVANIVSSHEQATIVTGVANLLMAALGGVMVPRFVMPDTMQAISQASPMAWGLDGFLDVMLRGGGLGMVIDSLWRLLAFAAGCLLLATLWMFVRRGKAGG